MSRAFSIAITACAAKFCDERDLLVGKRPHLLAKYDEHSKLPGRPCQRYVQDASHAARFDGCYRDPNAIGVRIRRSKVMNMEDPSVLDYARHHRRLIGAALWL